MPMTEFRTGTGFIPAWGPLVLKAGTVSLLALVVANCASQPQASRSQQSREVGAFSHPKYGKASPRVVGLDENAPRGGGRYQVGRPYVIAGKRYVPREKPDGFSQAGHASWYGIAFHGRKTANGEVYDRTMVSAAHPTMPLPSYARVTNTLNNHSIVVRVNDRGPYHGGRIIDVSERTAGLLGFKHMGTARVRVDYLGPASLAGSDDERLVASLRTNGPASAPQGVSPAVMVASARPPASQAPVATPTATRALGFAATAPVASNPVSSAPAPVSTPAARSQAETRFPAAPGLPVPPARPFDLETIGGASAPVAPGSVSQSPRAGLPRAQPVELALTDTAGLLTRFGQAGTGQEHWLKAPLARIGNGH